MPQRLEADNGHEFTRGSVPAVPRSDESAIGAAQAADEASGKNEIAIVGHGGSAEMLDLVADPASPFRADELAGDPRDKVLLVVNNAGA